MSEGGAPAPSDVPAIDVVGLRRSYGSVVAIDDVSVSVGVGEIVGLIGPNGAGKTTLLECMSGLRAAESGQVRVFGLDPQRHRSQVAEVLGVQLQHSQLPDRLRVHEAVTLYSAFYRHPADGDTLLDEFGLVECRRQSFASLSGGQRQRLAIVLALIGDPRAVILDELTTGLDPQARHSTWELVESLRDRGLTIVLSTHFMEEAERLCDRVLVLDGGHVVASGSPADLVGAAATRQRIFVDLAEPAADVLLADVVVPHSLSADRRQLVIELDDDRPVTDVMAVVERSGLRYRSFRVERPTLEEVYLALTGHDVRV